MFFAICLIWWEGTIALNFSLEPINVLVATDRYQWKQIKNIVKSRKERIWKVVLFLKMRQCSEEWMLSPVIYSIWPRFSPFVPRRRALRRLRVSKYQLYGLIR